MKTKDPATLEERRARRKLWAEQEAKSIEISKLKMLDIYSLERTPKFEKAYDIAWSLGHSGGIHEVENYFDEISPLLP